LSPEHERCARKDVSGVRKHFCIPNFVDTGLFVPSHDAGTKAEWKTRFGVPDDAFVIGCAAALRKSRKRVDALIEEVAMLADSRSRTSSIPYLMLAGAEETETAAIESLARSRLGKRCLVLKNLAYAQMPSFYNALDLFVLPAPEEMFGICFIEAMACGVPVVANDTPTLRWVVGSGGWCVDVTEPGFLSARWPQLVAERTAKRCAARSHVEQRFSWQAVFPQLMDMYGAVKADAASER
jgi:glycosyltransferase involved in cell wall biosynthesis